MSYEKINIVFLNTSTPFAGEGLNLFWPTQACFDKDRDLKNLVEKFKLIVSPTDAEITEHISKLGYVLAAKNFDEWFDVSSIDPIDDDPNVSDSGSSDEDDTTGESDNGELAADIANQHSQGT